MKKKVLIINQGAVLMVNRLLMLLKDAGLETAVIEPELEAVKIELEKTEVDVLVFITGEFVSAAQNVLTYLSNFCLEFAKPICLVGYENELEKVRESISSGVIIRNFPRPFDVKALSSEIYTLAYAEKEAGENKQLLLVDDDLTFLRIVKNWLGTKYNVAVARSGMQAISYLAEHKADLILLDFDMPVMSGPQVLEVLRSEAKTANIPVFFLTGKNDRESVMAVMKLKPEGYILKTTGSEDILKALQNFFAAHA